MKLGQRSVEIYHKLTLIRGNKSKFSLSGKKSCFLLSPTTALPPIADSFREE